MANKSKAALIAEEVLKANSFINTVYVTSDHKPFAVISDAQNYASKKFDDAEARKLQIFERDVLGIVAELKKEPKVSQIVKKIKEAKTVEDVKALIEKEHRPFVLKTAEARINHLSPNQEKVADNSKELEVLTFRHNTLQANLIQAEKAIKAKDKVIADKEAAIKQLKAAAGKPSTSN
ncbi:hypothetical protein [Tenacibaculum maritimum]|uniref:hypothetical protein n=1 Tax=Tenacibaculum maritimum TaxID=107401 RepID=UPI00041A1D07|nr:hypothetical protein [Tenacibaculum maritimum]